MSNTQASNDMSNSAANSGAIPLPADSLKLIHIVDIYLIFGV